MSHPVNPSESSLPQDEPSSTNRHDSSDEIVELELVEDDTAPTHPNEARKHLQRDGVESTTGAACDSAKSGKMSRPNPAKLRRSRLWTHGFLFALCSSIVTASLIMAAPDEEHVYLPGAEDPIPGSCMSREVLGIQCPGCGMTRAFISIGHLRFDRAWYFNPASFLLFILVAIQVPWQAMQFVRVWRDRQPISVLWEDKLLWVIAAAMLTQWLIRGFTDGFFDPPIGA